MKPARPMPGTPRHPPSEGTKKMVEQLKKVAVMTQDWRSILANGVRAKHFGNPTVFSQTPENKVYVYSDMLAAGMTEETIDSLKATLTQPMGDITRLKLKRLLGVAYLRLAEQENCVVNHTAQSCLVPIQPGGYHKFERGSRSAIEVYTDILNVDSTDLKSQWLLNIAYMTLGEYPNKVPQRWLIPPEVFKSDYEIPHFTDIAPALGLDLPRLSGGACLEDFDNDGDIDILTSSFGPTDELLYFRNNGDGSFSDKTAEAGLIGITGGLNMFHADFDNDGYGDVLITRGAWMGSFGNQPKSLLHNNGDGTFDDVAIEAGVSSPAPSEAAAWGDFDNDGWLDLFVGNETTSQPHPCQLFHNNHDGTFTDVAHETGMDFLGMAKSVAWGDYDNDGYIDLYITSLGQPNRLMRNNGKKGGKWTFTDVAQKAGVTNPLFSFPTFFFDYDNDGWLDLFVCDYGGNATGNINGLPAVMDVTGPVVNDYLGKPSITTTPALYHNNHDGTFTDVGKKMGLTSTLFGMGCNYGDLDNDGWIDIYVGTGHPDLDVLIPNRMLRNGEGKIFQDVTTSGGFGHLQKGHGIAWADIDDDGDQDIFAEMGGAYEADVARMALYQNPGNSNHWITILLNGVKANRLGTGARIKATVQRADGSQRDIYLLAGTGGSFGSSSLQQEMGLGDAKRIMSLTIDWPGSHTKQVLTDVPMDRTIKVTEGKKDVVVVERHPIAMGAPGTPPAHDPMHDMQGMPGMQMPGMPGH
jgi:hypothetical protein